VFTDLFNGSGIFIFIAVFGKVVVVASEEVTVELLKVKCLPVMLLYGLEACPR